MDEHVEREVLRPNQDASKITYYSSLEKREKQTKYILCSGRSLIIKYYNIDRSAKGDTTLLVCKDIRRQKGMYRKESNVVFDGVLAERGVA